MDKLIKVSVLGSCVSREMFNYSNNFEVISTVYSSYISLFEDKIDVTQDDCRIPTISKFESRNVYLEFNKKVFDYLEKNKADYLLIDFAEVINEYYLVSNKDYDDLKVKIVATPSIKEILIKKNYDLTRVTSSDCDFKKLMKMLFDNLCKIYDKDKIFLIKTPFSKFYIGKDNKIHIFSSHYRLLQKNIDRVRKFENEAIKYLNAENIIDFNKNIIADENHKYGCSPVHYADFEYEYMVKACQSKLAGIDLKNLMNPSLYKLMQYKNSLIQQVSNHSFIFDDNINLKIDKFWEGYKIANRVCSFDLTVLYVIVNRHIGDAIRYLRCLRYIKDYYSDRNSEYHFNDNNIQNKLFKKKKKIQQIHVLTRKPLDGVAKLYDGIDTITILDKNELTLLEFYAASGISLHNNIICDEDAKRQVLGAWSTDEGAYTRALMFGVTDFMWDLCVPKTIKFSLMRIGDETERATKSYIARENFNIEKSIILCPYAQSSSSASYDYFNNFIDVLNEKGFVVYTNIANNDEVLPKTKPLSVSIDVLACLAKYGVRVIGVQSGVMDVLSKITPQNLTTIFIIKTDNDRQYAQNRGAVNEVTKISDNITYLRIEHFEEDYVLKLLMDNFH